MFIILIIFRAFLVFVYNVWINSYSVRPPSGDFQQMIDTIFTFLVVTSNEESRKLKITIYGGQLFGKSH